MKNKFLSSSDNMSKHLKHDYLNSIKSKFKHNKLLLPYILLFLGFMSFILFYKMEYSAASTALAKNTIRFHVRAFTEKPRNLILLKNTACSLLLITKRF